MVQSLEREANVELRSASGGAKRAQSTLPPGAHPDDRGTAFVVFSTAAKKVSVRLFDEAGASVKTEALDPLGEGCFERHLEGVRPGALYKLVLDGDEVPDPYARFLPLGVHGPARVIARAEEPALAEPPPAHRWVIYEIHVGTFSPEGTYRGVEDRLDAIAELGVTAIELLPVAAFPGARGWGYDGVALYAPYAGYGEPDDLRSLVRAAHARGLAVILDVVYNHFGPAGNYLSKYAPSYFTSAIQTPWGSAPDYGHAPMRKLALDNARYWLTEFGFDALRLDATHAIHDTSKLHVIAEVAALAHGLTPPRRIFCEDERNEPALIEELGVDGIWADDFHHQVRVLLTGERDGYYAAYEPSVSALASAIRGGWTYTGQPYAPWSGKPRGKSARALAPESFLYCIQNHDQIGNRALGTRLSHDVEIDAYCAASVLLLFLPMTPILFMGQEWASSSPFLFFSDHEGELGEAVRKGRREEFKSFSDFADPEKRRAIPDPQEASTFERSKLAWDERKREPHARVLAIYRAMLELRRDDPVLGAPCARGDLDARTEGQVLMVSRRHGTKARTLFVNFGDSERAVDPPMKGRALFVSGRFEEGEKLAPKSAVVLADD